MMSRSNSDPSCQRPLLDYPEFRKLHSLFQHLWTKAVGSSDYDKREWVDLDNMLTELGSKARDKLGRTE